MFREGSERASIRAGGSGRCGATCYHAYDSLDAFGHFPAQRGQPRVQRVEPLLLAGQLLPHLTKPARDLGRQIVHGLLHDAEPGLNARETGGMEPAS
jgi:hypothetical protein